MRILSLIVGFIAVVALLPHAADAAMYVSISDGTTTVSGSSSLTAKGGFRLYKTSPAQTTSTSDYSDTLNVLACSTRPCTVYFPSGSATKASSDTFKFQDASSTSPLRVIKFDSYSSTDRLDLKGATITSLVSGKTLTVTFGIQSGDLRTIASTSTSISYTGIAAMSGSFRTSTGTRATSCGDGTTSTSVLTSCAKVSLKINGTTVDGSGTSTVATVSVPCNNQFPSSNPCGTGGTYYSTGSFSGVNDAKSIGCTSPCKPYQVGTAVARFGGTGDVLRMEATATGGVANITDEQGGLAEAFLSFFDELGANRWLAYSAANEQCLAIPQPPLTNQTRNVNNQSSIPLAFELECAPLVAATGPVSLVSIVDPKETTTSLATDAGRNDRSYATFIPDPGLLRVGDITVLSLQYDVITGTAYSGQRQLGDVLFSDCGPEASVRVDMQVFDPKGAPAGTLRIYLGSDPTTNFKSGCDGHESIGLDLVTNPDDRVDPSALAGNLAAPCCITFKQAQGKYGKLVNRQISLVVDQGLTPPSPALNHRVDFSSGTINGFTSLGSLQTVGTLAEVPNDGLPTTGRSMVITKLTQNGVPSAPVIVKVIQNQDIANIGGQLRAQVNVNDLQPDVGGTSYRIDLCLNGPTFDPTDPTVTPPPPLTVTGICIPDQGFMTLL